MSHQDVQHRANKSILQCYKCNFLIKLFCLFAQAQTQIVRFKTIEPLKVAIVYCESYPVAYIVMVTSERVRLPKDFMRTGNNAPSDVIDHTFRCMFKSLGFYCL